MEEDVIGLEHALGRKDYLTCTRCGAIIRERDAHYVPADALEGGTDYAPLCDSCAAATASGETELPLPPE